MRIHRSRPSQSSLLATALVATLLGSACTKDEPVADPKPTTQQGASQKKRVMVTNYPLAYLTNRVAGDTVDIEFPAPRDVDPAYWKPDDAVLRRFQEADLIVLNGAGYEPWAAMTSLPASKIVDTTKAFADGLIESGETVTHSHGPAGEHSHSGTAFTVWLDPMLASRQAAAIRDAIVPLVRVTDQPNVVKRFDWLEQQLKEYDEVLAGIVNRDRQRPVIASHPVYQYLARRYRMNLKSVHWEPDQATTEAQWQEFDALHKDHPAISMIWESQPLDATVAALKKRGVTSVVVSPCANVPPTGDLMVVLQANADALSIVYKM